MKRVFLTVLDGAGVGYLPDAAQYGDVGACTIGHVVETCRPHLPNMARMGLGHIEGSGVAADPGAVCAYGRSMEASAGKDTTTGHWELAGLKLERPFPTFPEGFPADFIARFEEAIGHKVIGNKPASGTAILDELGAEHLANRTPIVYTSADSVFQIACHEDIFSVPELYQMCQIARDMLQGELCVGRVIARPFTGVPGAFKRSKARRDFAVPPFGETLLDVLSAAGMASIGVGKIEDIFDHRGLTQSNHAAGNPACIDAWMDYMKQDFTGLCFTNLVDTDMQYGHRNDPEGFAGALEYFDRKLPEIQALMGDEDLLIVTADHGCDPCFPGTDHTREHIPLMVWHKKMQGCTDLGLRTTYADVAATCAQWLGLPHRFGATSFADKL